MTALANLGNIVHKGISLGNKTAYRVGGTAEYYAEPASDAELQEVLRRSSSEGLDVRFLGQGTNLLVGDDGVSGLVLKLSRTHFSFIKNSKSSLMVGAGYSLPALVKWSVNQRLSGLECLVGVPGTVGAALRMNAGGKYGEIGERVRRVWGYEYNGEPFDYDRKRCRFAYRTSGLKDRIVTGCELELEACADALACSKLKSIIMEKKASQPLSKRSAGCVFKNPGKPGVPSAGKLIDELGFKGIQVGGASVSSLHANFLVCRAGAKALDLVRLIRSIRQRVLQERGVLLELEIAVWGVSDEALLPGS